MTRHEIRSDDSWGGQSSLIDKISELQEILDNVPEEYRESAQITIDGAGDYEVGHRVTLEVWYDAPETEAERIAREHQARLYLDAQIRRHKNQLEALLEEQAKKES